jgi:cytochrome-b5 reductase
MITPIIISLTLYISYLGFYFYRNKFFLKTNDKKLILIKKDIFSNTLRNFYFLCPDNIIDTVGQHIILINNNLRRTYTPINITNNIICLAVRIYENGKMTPYLDQMKIGDTIEFEYKKSLLSYCDDELILKNKHVENNNIVMIACGTGIAPMIQMINHIHTKKLTLLYAARDPTDILCKEMIDSKMKNNVWYTVNHNDNNEWNYSTGYINDSMLEKVGLDDSSFVVLCGPYSMTKSVKKLLEGKCKKDNILVL